MDPTNMESASELRSWSDLPIDIIHMIVSCLPLADYPSFSSVCKEWSQVVPLVYPACKCPLLAHYKRKDRGVCRYYSPYFNKTFVVDCPLSLSGSRFLYSREGWMMLAHGCSYMFVNPITCAFRELELDEEYHYGSSAFSSRPSSSDCILFTISGIVDSFVHICTVRGEDWTDRMSVHLDNNLPFVMSDYSNPVFLHGQFYCLGAEGNLGVFDPNRYKWSVLAKPEKPAGISYQRSFLVESKGELLSVYVGEYSSSFHVYRLNQADMVWEKVESLDDQALFLGWPMSISTTTCGKRMKNKLCFSKRYGEAEVVEANVKISGDKIFFVPKSRVTSLEQRDKLKHTSSEGICYYDLETSELFGHQKTSEDIHSIWFEPEIQDILS